LIFSGKIRYIGRHSFYNYMDQTRILALQWQVANNDERAYREIFLWFYPRLVAFANNLVRDTRISEEIVSDVLTRIWLQREKLQEILQLSVYLFTAVKNSSLNFLSWKSRDLISYVETYPDHLLAREAAPDKLLMTSEMARRMDDAVNALPSKCKLVYTMVRDYGLRYREVAEILHISERTVDTQMTIANRKLSAVITLLLPDHPRKK
jgi:RNA polymerase sigma-70 factor (ECF subfamily)